MNIVTLNVSQIRIGSVPKFLEGRLDIGCEHDPSPSTRKFKYPYMATMRPEWLFNEHTYISDPDVEADIAESCWSQGYLAWFGDHPRFGRVFHTLSFRDRIARKAIADEVVDEDHHDPTAVANTSISSEAEIERSIAEWLRGRGVEATRQVGTSAGIADVVTLNAIYEVKRCLGRTDMYQAIGQVLLYRASLNPNLKAYVVGPARAETKELAKHAVKCGVGVIAWKDGKPEWIMEVSQ